MCLARCAVAHYCRGMALIELMVACLLMALLASSSVQVILWQLTTVTSALKQAHTPLEIHSLALQLGRDIFGSQSITLHSGSNGQSCYIILTAAEDQVGYRLNDGVLRQRFPNINGPRKDDICYATQNRQDAVRQLAEEAQLMLVVGAKNSSNSNRLRELSEKMSTPAYLIDDANGIQREWLNDIDRVAVTAGASAPEVLVREVIEQLKAWGGKTVSEREGREENITFSIPPDLR